MGFSVYWCTLKRLLIKSRVTWALDSAPLTVVTVGEGLEGKWGWGLIIRAKLKDKLTFA
jgi:hypothetical protein